jgi:ferrous iron transport protein B
VIIALNMVDILEKKGIHININQLKEELDADIIPISALKKTGIQELIDRIKTNQVKTNCNQMIFAPIIETGINRVLQTLQGMHMRFVAIKLLERDPLFTSQQNEVVLNQAKLIEETFNSDVEEVIASGRYQYITALRKRAVSEQPKKTSVTDKLDRILLNRWLALPIFVAIMFLVYYVAVGAVGSLTVALIDGLVVSFGEWVRAGLLSLNASNWSASLVVDGLIAGGGLF